MIRGWSQSRNGVNKVHNLLRYTTASTPTQESIEFSNRANAIRQNPNQFYPVLNSLRDKDAKLLRIPEFRKIYSNIEFPKETNRIDELCSVEGKIISIRKAGKAMYFIDIKQDDTKIQIVASNALMNLSKQKFASDHEILKRGDYICCVGFPGTTKVGELSLKSTMPIRIASASLIYTPEKLENKEIIHQNRVLDYLVNKSSVQTVLARSSIISSIRNFLVNKDFTEVQTPIISSASKGANATPFATQSRSIKDKAHHPLDLHLRVAPELWLKRLVISGFDKVFEIGPVFRNEGIDATHNPEFTTCEFYQSFVTLEDLIEITESLFQYILLELKKKNLDTTNDHINRLTSELNINGGFQKIEYIPTIEKVTGEVFPTDVNTPNLLEFFKKVDLPIPSVRSPAQLLDELSAHFLEPLCGDCPTIIYHHPAVLSPLAKSTMIDYNGRQFDISRRFELFINKREYVNAYEEENNPFEQSAKFQLQLKAREDFNDQESLIPDAKYLEAMEMALPPTGGWGIGIDRMVMLLTGSPRIDKVLTFGQLSDVIKQ